MSRFLRFQHDFRLDFHVVCENVMKFSNLRLVVHLAQFLHDTICHLDLLEEDVAKISYGLADLFSQMFKTTQSKSSEI